MEDFAARVRKNYRVESGTLVARDPASPGFEQFMSGFASQAPHLFATSTPSSGSRVIRQSGEPLDVNPWKPGVSFNITKQARPVRTNPVLAAKPAKEAGAEMIPRS